MKQLQIIFFQLIKYNIAFTFKDALLLLHLYIYYSNTVIFILLLNLRILLLVDRNFLIYLLGPNKREYMIHQVALLVLIINTSC